MVTFPYSSIKTYVVTHQGVTTYVFYSDIKIIISKLSSNVTLSGTVELTYLVNIIQKRPYDKQILNALVTDTERIVKGYGK